MSSAQAAGMGKPAGSAGKDNVKRTVGKGAGGIKRRSMAAGRRKQACSGVGEG